MFKFSHFLLAEKLVCYTVKFAYDFMALKKIAVYYVLFQNCFLIQR